MDAVRERCLSDETVPSPDGWSQIGRKMRQAAIRRRSVLAVALLISISAILLWSPWNQTVIPDVPGSTHLAENAIPSETDDSFVTPEDEPVLTRTVSSILLSEEKEAPKIQSDGAFNQDTSSVNPKITVEPDESNKPDEPDKPRQDSPMVSIEPYEAFSEPVRRLRPRLFIGVTTSSGMTHRKTDVTLQSTPYIAALTYMNTIELPAGTRGILSNYSNTVGYGIAANQFFPSSTTNHYHHDLPLSLGITARMEMTPHLGIESGIEYTYLHSSVESVAGNLDQQLHLIGIPLRMDVRLWSHDRFTLYAGLSAMAEKCVAASIGKINCEEKRVLWSTGTFAGVQYQIGGRAYLYFQPQLSYSITNTDLITYRTENPLVFSLNAGLRFDL